MWAYIARNNAAVFAVGCYGSYMGLHICAIWVILYKICTLKLQPVCYQGYYVEFINHFTKLKKYFLLTMMIYNNSGLITLFYFDLFIKTLINISTFCVCQI